MTDLWYNNPSVLLTNIEQFVPDKHLSKNEKINAIARLAILFALIIIIFKKEDTQLLYISVIILIISLFLGTTEDFTSTNLENASKKSCQEPTEDNPFSNYILGDLIDNKDKLPACDYNNVKNKMRQKFKKKIHTDISDLYGKYTSDRNFYSMPSTTIVNDRESLTKWLIGQSGECKTEGKNCLKWTDPSFQKGRIIPYTDNY